MIYLHNIYAVSVSSVREISTSRYPLVTRVAAGSRLRLRCPAPGPAPWLLCVWVAPSGQRSCRELQTYTLRR